MRSCLKRRWGYGLARCGVAAAAGIVLVSLVGPGLKGLGNENPAESRGSRGTEPAPAGAPRDWQGGLQVSTY